MNTNVSYVFTAIFFSKHLKRIIKIYVNQNTIGLAPVAISTEYWFCTEKTVLFYFRSISVIKNNYI